LIDLEPRVARIDPMKLLVLRPGKLATPLRAQRLTLLSEPGTDRAE
jgi:hypothetical protein